MNSVMFNLRKHYEALIDALLSVGDRDQAYACAQVAVNNGVWKDPRQRPARFDPALPPKAIYDPSGLWFVPYLESHYPTIQEEVLRVAGDSAEGFSPVEEPLVARGRWDEVIFYEAGIRMERACALFPKTANIMSNVPEAIRSGGVVMLSWLGPNSHIMPHCGGSNTKLRVHLGIKVPQGASMRVGDERFVWQEGRCIVFDDSFEHEVWNLSQEPRLVLLFDIIHPLLSSMPQGVGDEPSNNFEEMIRTYLTTRGIAEVERDPSTDKLTVTPDRATELTIKRYMKDHDATRVGLAHGNVVID